MTEMPRRAAKLLPVALLAAAINCSEPSEIRSAPPQPISLELGIGAEGRGSGFAAKKFAEKSAQKYFSSYINSTFRTGDPRIIAAIKNSCVLNYPTAKPKSSAYKTESGKIRIDLNDAKKIPASMETVTGLLLGDVWKKYHPADTVRLFVAYSDRLKKLQEEYAGLGLTIGVPRGFREKSFLDGNGLFNDRLKPKEREDLMKFLEWNPYGIPKMTEGGAYAAMGVSSVPALFTPFYEGVFTDEYLRKVIDADNPLKSEKDFERIEKLIKKLAKGAAGHRWKHIQEKPEGYSALPV